MPQHPLHVGQRHLRVPGHPIGRGMPQIVQRPVRAQRGVGAGEHRPGRVIASAAETGAAASTTAARPARPAPARPAAPDTAAATRTRPVTAGSGCNAPGSLADHRDQLLARVGVADRGAQQLRGPRPGRDPERDQRPVPVRAQLRRTARRTSRPGCAAAPACTTFGRYRPPRCPANGSIGLWCACARPGRRCRASGNGLTIGPVPASRWKS